MFVRFQRRSVTNLDHQQTLIRGIPGLAVPEFDFNQSSSAWTAPGLNAVRFAARFERKPRHAVEAENVYL